MMHNKSMVGRAIDRLPTSVRYSPLTTIFLLVFGLALGGYAIFEASGYLYGPRIQVAAVANIVHDSFITIHGQATHINALALNGADVAVTTDGRFAIPFLLTPGDNRLVLDAKDAYGRTRSQVVEVVYIP